MKLLSFSALLLLSVIGCKQSSDTSTNGGGSPVVWTAPSVGTIYILKNLTSPLFDTFEIVKTGLTGDNQTNVIEATWPPNEINYGSYYCFDEDGNYSFSPELNSLWHTIPTEGTNPVRVPYAQTMDTTYPNGGWVHYSDSIYFFGTETVSVPAGNFVTLHDREVNIQDEFYPSNPSQTLLDTSFTDTWWAPSISYWIKQTINENDSNTRVLQQYLPH